MRAGCTELNGAKYTELTSVRNRIYLFTFLELFGARENDHSAEDDLVSLDPKVHGQWVQVWSGGL